MSTKKTDPGSKRSEDAEAGPSTVHEALAREAAEGANALVVDSGGSGGDERYRLILPNRAELHVGERFDRAKVHYLVSVLASLPALAAETTPEMASPSSGILPNATSAEPTAMSAEPTAMSAEPTAMSAEPTAMSAEPTAMSAEPTAMSAEPTAMSAEPTAMSVEPTAMSVEPTLVTEMSAESEPASH